MNDAGEQLAGVGVTLDIRDPSSEFSNDLFAGVDSPSVSGGLSSVDGMGTLAPGQSGTAQWILIPYSEAAPNEPLEYDFGGELTYTTSAGTLTVPLAPVRLIVQPNPRLNATYFWERDVYGDDPLTTDTIEPQRPFSVGLIISNSGHGVANNVRVTSAQPVIISNERGLVIDFRIIGTEVHGAAIAPTLTAALGDIGPVDSDSRARVARWLMTSTFSGFFSNFSARMEHIDGLGDPRLSLFEGQPEIHSLTHAVRTVEPGDDAVIDFLADEVSYPDDPNESDPFDPNRDPERLALPDTLHTSDGRIEPVTVVLDGQAQVISGNRVRVTAPVTGGWNYIKVPNPLESAYELVRVVRSDGREIRVGDNAWQTDRIFVGQSQDRLVRHRLHLFDYGGTGDYTLYFEGANVTPAITEWQALTSHGSDDADLIIPPIEEFSESRSGGTETIVLSFNKPIDPATLRPESIAIAGLNAQDEPIALSPGSWSVEIAFDRRSARIHMLQPLPNAARYCVRLAGVADHFGSLIGSNVNRTFTVLAGDITGDRRVNNTDVGAVRGLMGTDPIDLNRDDHVRADINRDGRIDSLDEAIALAARGADLRFAGDPCLLITTIPTNPHVKTPVDPRGAHAVALSEAGAPVPALIAAVPLPSGDEAGPAAEGFEPGLTGELVFTAMSAEGLSVGVSRDDHGKDLAVVLLPDGSARPLPRGPFVSTEARGINRLGVVCGTAVDSEGHSHAVLWHPPLGIVSLSDLIPAGEGQGRLISADTVSDDLVVTGQVHLENEARTYSLALVFEPSLDLTGDERVDLSDVRWLLGNMGTPGTLPDLNGDGMIDAKDVARVLAAIASRAELQPGRLSVKSLMRSPGASHLVP